MMPSLRTAGGGKLGLVVEGLIGLAMLVHAIRTPTTARSAPKFEHNAGPFATLVFLGITVATMELATAVPYFGAIALLTTADLPVDQWLPLLVLYNTIFVFPPTLLLMGHIVFESRLDSRYGEIKEQVQAGASETMLWIFCLVGIGLLVSSVVELIARSR